MDKFFNSLKILLVVMISFLMIACAHTEPITDRSMTFEEGIKALAVNLADQVEKSSIGNMVNKVIKNHLKKIVIDPFIDMESGYPVKVNARIKNIISMELNKRFAVTGEMEPDNLGISEYVLNGMVTLVEKRGGLYKVSATIFEKSSGKVLAAASVHVGNFDTTPMDIYKDSPVYLKGKNYQAYTSSVNKAPAEEVNEDYHNRLTSKSMQVKGDLLYEQKEYKKSLSYYNQAASTMDEVQLEVLNGQFTNFVKQVQWQEAETVYARLLRKSIAETSEITSKITFAPKATVELESKAQLYNIYMKEIAKFVASTAECRVSIIGHCSRTGKADYNDKLSLQRALWIQRQMASYEPVVMRKSESFGHGFRENIVGTGRDDITDQIDRRVEFKFNGCAAK